MKRALHIGNNFFQYKCPAMHRLLPIQIANSHKSNDFRWSTEEDWDNTQSCKYYRSPLYMSLRRNSHLGCRFVLIGVDDRSCNNEFHYSSFGRRRGTEGVEEGGYGMSYTECRSLNRSKSEAGPRASQSTVNVLCSIQIMSKPCHPSMYLHNPLLNCDPNSSPSPISFH